MTAAAPRARRTLAAAGLAHAPHDGFSSFYVPLPLRQARLGLEYAAPAALRALHVGSVAGLQVPAGRLGGTLLPPRLAPAPVASPGEKA